MTANALADLLALATEYLADKDFPSAVVAFRKALALKPDASDLHIALANCLKKTGELNEAIEHYQLALKQDPKSAEAHNNLATLFYQQNKLHEALVHYANAVQLKPDYVDAHYNLGLLFIKKNDLDAASKQFSNVTALMPKHAQAHYQLAHLFYQQNKLNEAVKAYQAVLHLQPQHLEAHNNLGVVYFKQGLTLEAMQCYSTVLRIDEDHIAARNNLAATLMQLDRYHEAAWQYQELLKRIPEDVEAHYNLGVALLALGDIKQAAEHFEAAIQHRPDYADAHANLATALIKMREKNKAIHHYQIALRLKPNDPIVRYMLDALTGEHMPSEAPNEYVKNLFDTYAHYFDHHLVETLHYQVPTLLRHAFEKTSHPTNTSLDILDLGCGTGLSGMAFRDLAKRLVGIDLSPKMIAVAKNKAIYDDLIVSDITNAVKQFHQQLDLIIAADTLVYIGDLTDIFSACWQALRPGGFFIFSTECGKGTGYALTETARYAHAEKYIEQLAKTYGFKLCGKESVTTRHQENEAVAGQLFILKTQV